MKKFFIFTFFVVVASTSCKKEASSPQSYLESPDDISTVSAANKTKPYTFDLTGSQLYNSCTGQDMVCLQGTGHLNQQFGGSQYHLVFHVDNFLCQAVDGTGPVYRGTGSPFIIEIPNQGGGIKSYTINYKLILTTPGGGNNSVLHNLVEVTVNANDITTVNIDKMEMGCK